MLASDGADGAGLILITFNFNDMVCCLLLQYSILIWYGTYFDDVVSIKVNTKTQVNLLSPWRCG